MHARGQSRDTADTPTRRRLNGGLAGETLDRLVLDDTRVVRRETVLQGIGRIRDVRQGPDGYIYLAVDDRGGEPTPVVRLEPLPRS